MFSTHFGGFVFKFSNFSTYETTFQEFYNSLYIYINCLLEVFEDITFFFIKKMVFSTAQCCKKLH